MRALKFVGISHPHFSKVNVFGKAKRISYQQKNHSEPEKNSFSEWLAETLISGNLVQIFLFRGFSNRLFRHGRIHRRLRDCFHHRRNRHGRYRRYGCC